MTTISTPSIFREAKRDVDKVRRLVSENPNDQDLGKKIRAYLVWAEENSTLLPKLISDKKNG